MIQVKINSRQKQVNFVVTGHAGFADYGYDIVCSAVSVLLMHTANHLSKADISDDGKRYELAATMTNEVDQAFVSALQDTLALIAGSYPKNLRVVYE